ncbi:hypothetical protein GUJ93_ZPchr0008g12459 [Zizania palustris]|uniref:CCHC-type domain-containing protein n=1 Tax=Zizania palustris TaxID=103762 RepID=A0A8J5V1U9_ZIZPA|nr:hypothetical protein GUJ93_ZPchr0008g12459 [Zizania palustris]
MLLRLHTVSVAHVLFDDPPPPVASGDDGDGALAVARKKWARDDAVCRGHILAALSNRIFPDYVRHGTARAAWEAVARTYDVDASGVVRRMLDDLEFDDGTPLLEQIAHGEALSAAMRFPLSDDSLADTLCEKLPDNVALPAMVRSSMDGGGATMRDVWHVARIVEASRLRREDLKLHGKCWNCGKLGHDATNCMT